MTFALLTRTGRTVVRGGHIADPTLPVEFTLSLGDGDLIAGLINAHDHLYLNHYPRLGSPPYRNSYDWGRDIHARNAVEIQRASALPRHEALLFGALKNLLGGVTTVVHHDPWSEVFESGFPVRVVRVRVAHSLRFERDLAGAVAGDAVTRDLRLSMHLAEGTDDAAAREVADALGQGLLNSDLIAVHLVGVDAEGIRLLERTKTAAVWCPTSNGFLLGRTAPTALFQSGVDVLIGTDSLLTADGTMLDELRAARRLGYLTDEQLGDAVGAVPARRLGLPLCTLAPGDPADLVFLRKPIFEASPADVALVVVNGEPKLADAEFASLFDHCRVQGETLVVCGVEKLVAAPLGKVASTVFDLTPECRRIVEEPPRAG